MATYESFNLELLVRRAHNYLTSMIDAQYDFLPYWFVQINEVPAFARHVRVDDAELVASWYEALVCCMEMLHTAAGANVLAGFQRHLLKSWGAHGLRFHERYPWTNTMHSSFHEMGYVLAALNRWRAREPGHAELVQRHQALIRGMRGLVWERTLRVFWSGDFPFDQPVYEFPNDVYLQDGGFDFSRVTGRGESAIRNAVVLQPLVKAYQLFGDEVALDLARGTANYVLGLSRYLGYDGRYLGHVHSTLWFATGLVLLGRLTNTPQYIASGKVIFDFTLAQSSSFGWMPEYIAWHPPHEEHCESCCLRDALECAFELIACGYAEYWAVIDRFTRNQLAEQQIATGSFVSVDATRADADGHTWRAIDQRVVGGWSGGGEPNTISLTRFRSVAGCCIGTVPQALKLVWDNILTRTGAVITANLPMNHTHPLGRVQTGYPNYGRWAVTATKAGVYAIRLYDWMGTELRTSIDGVPVAATLHDGCLVFPPVRTGQTIAVQHPLAPVVRTETARGVTWTVTWQGSDVVNLDPPGPPLRLYQRDCSVPKEYPAPGTGAGAAPSLAPTEQKR